MAAERSVSIPDVPARRAMPPAATLPKLFDDGKFAAIDCHEDSKDQRSAENDLLRKNVDAYVGHADADDRDDQGADHCAANASDAAGDCRASDDHRAMAGKRS